MTGLILIHVNGTGKVCAACNFFFFTGTYEIVKMVMEKRRHSGSRRLEPVQWKIAKMQYMDRKCDPNVPIVSLFLATDL